ncbi:hypothetical protein [Desulfobulbus elongatus]|uniref:hypothetical protein n=1 Tax=Desulfobulbus elongatus TaxID=53332 RepID=UPI000ACEB7A9|nr:hypothetical protein [Desulfobulbus elongatus]
MKKMNLVAGMLFAAAVLATSAYAASAGTAVANTADQQAYYDQTATLRSNLAADRAELQALINSNSPDAKRIRTLSENITRGHDELRQQAEKYNVAWMGHGGMMAGEPCGYGPGPHGFMHGSMMNGTGEHHQSGGGFHHM